MTPKDRFLALLSPACPPGALLSQYEALHILFDTPVMNYLDQNRAQGTRYRDLFGTTFVFEDGAPGPTPYITEETKVCPDIECWQDFVHAPDVAGACAGDEEGWAASRAEAEKARKAGKLATCLMGTGIFEQLHFLMGFEDTLVNFYEYPDEMHELIDYLLEYRLGIVRLLVEKIHPDAILSHDDWGAKDRLFMNPDMWREFFKEPYRKFYGAIRQAGVVAIHHGDCYMAPLAEDMAEIGIQVWQGAVPENNIPALQAQLGGRLVLMGGIGAAIDRSDAGREEIFSYVTEQLEQDAPGGHFIPCITYGAPGTVFPQVNPVINEAIKAYNERHALT